MLVMAIEAANQMADPSRAVAGFDLKDVLFQRALHIPTSQPKGIETNLYLRQIHDISDMSASWSEFRLCSFESNDLQENCRGFIRVKYETNPNAVDGEREFLGELNQCRCIDDRLSQSCTEAFDPNQLYQTLRSCGFGFGPTFQPLRTGSCSTNNEARSEVMLYQWPASEHPQQHVIHPTTLDGILHLSVAALAQGGRKSVSTAVPNLLRKMWIAKSGLSYPGNTLVNAAAWVTAIDNRGTDFDISVLDTSKTHVLARVEGLRSTIVADHAEFSVQKLAKKQICYHVELKPDVDLLDHEQLMAYCAEARYRLPEPVQFYQDLESVLLAFLAQSVEVVDAIQAQSLQPHLRRYLGWAKLQLKKYHHGELRHDQPNRHLLLQDNEKFESLCEAVGATNDLGRVFVTTGRSLTCILRGEVEPFRFLSKTDLLRDFYREVNGSRTCFPEFARYLDALTHKNPSVRVLEVGAGTGGMTEKILSALSVRGNGQSERPRFSSYSYTDISSTFFEQARIDFQYYPNIEFKTLDIETDPSLQGYETDAYDLIIAANILHATKDINVTMQNVRKLLKQGGKLVMYEPTQPDSLRTGFITGLMPEWWSGTESYREFSPSLSYELWGDVLRDNGFSGLDLELPDFIDNECQQGSILVTTAISIGPVESKHSTVVLVADLSSRSQVNIAQHLKASLVTEGSLSCEVLSFNEAASLGDKSEIHFAFLEELERPVLSELTSETYLALQELLVSAKSIFWISDCGGASPKRPEYAVINGLSRVLRNENPERPFITLALDLQGDITEKQLQSIHRCFQTVQHNKFEPLSYEPEFVEINGFLNIARAVQANQLSEDLFLRSLPQQSLMRTFRQSSPLKLAIKSPGLLDTFHFVEDDDYLRPLASDEIEIEVQTIGLNFRDCLIALGRVPGSSFGSECAGVINRVGKTCDLRPGDRVVMSATEAFKTLSRGKAHQVFKIPDDMTFIEAASIPSQFGTAWEALHGLARLREGEKILIHAGAGGTGQAAIQISQHFGAEIFATVGSEAKKSVLINEYGIQADHIFYSRDTSFAKGIMRMTENRGVDVILNSLAGESLIASWECIAPYGRFIEIGKKDILSNSKLPMYPFRKNTSFSCLDGFTFQVERPMQAREGFETILNLFAEGKLHAVRPLHSYSISNVEEAFRLMQEGNIAGKIVLEVTPNVQVPVRNLHIQLKSTE